MREFLQKIKLIDHLTTEVQMPVTEFVDKLEKVVDKGETGFYSNAFEAFSGSKNVLKGRIDYDGFRIKQRRSFFDRNIHFAVANGSFTENNHVLLVETEINGFFKPFFFVLIFIFPIYIFQIVNSGPIYPIFIQIILFVLFVVGFPYFMMRRSVHRLKYELEKVFFYIVKANDENKRK